MATLTVKFRTVQGKTFDLSLDEEAQVGLPTCPVIVDRCFLRLGAYRWRPEACWPGC